MTIIKKILRLLKTNAAYYLRDYYHEAYYGQDYYLDNVFRQHKKLETYLELLELDNKQPLLTDVNISFSDNQNFHENEVNFFKLKYGKPNYSISNSYPFGEIKKLFYRVHIGTHKVKMELNFFENSLFLYNYTFSQIKNSNEKIEIQNLLKKKYQIDEKYNLLPDNYYIIDRNQSVIVLSDNVNFTINYILNTNSNLYNQMKNALKKEIGQDEHLADRNKQEIYKRL
ncbi:hypothetical protein SAMN05192553_102944 [Cyclobacterium xiamenense]|uniref:Uncharacterized protein n=1 Tax=Cyclobacterium xiamenense TaxID=1297121 RepID=A0A1H6WWA1_9BACT|nr:hypothetical protein [Cyclobacterium xiamenense]SEJ21143.1 hypothetical protein SAMN05192553_102944 [Cyclobacterium xiamenense]